jgi:hypothetical protein
MTPARIDLEFRPRTPLLLRGFGWAMLALGVASMVWVGRQQESVDQRREEAKARLELLQVRDASEAASQDDPEHEQEMQKQVQRANAVIDRLALPWDNLFRSVESAESRGMGLLTLAPSPEDHALRISGEARTTDEVLAYIERLGAQAALSHVHLVSFDTVQRDGVDLIEFVVGATWR